MTEIIYYVLLVGIAYRACYYACEVGCQMRAAQKRRQGFTKD